MKRLKVLMTTDAIGGVWQYSLELARALIPLGFDVRLALLGPGPSVAQRAELAATPKLKLIETGILPDWLAEDPDDVRRGAAAIAALAEAERVDLVHLNQPAFGCEGMPVPTVAALHSCVATWWAAVERGPMPDAFRWRTDLVHAGLLTADARLCPTAAFAAAVQRVYTLSEAPAVVHNGRTPLPVASGALHDFVLTVGRLWDRGKNLAPLDRAAARISVPVKAAGALVGPHGETAALKHIHAMGSVSAATLAGLLSARPVFAAPAHYEPFGLAVLEAAQAGCPLVLSDIPTFRELWDGVAWFVRPDDADGLADALDRLLADIPERLGRGELARRHAARYTPAAMAAGVAALYARLGVIPADGKAAA